MNSKCITPEMPYCPSCEYGRVVYPDWVETYEDIYDSGCEWVCLLENKEDKKMKHSCSSCDAMVDVEEMDNYGRCERCQEEKGEIEECDEE